MVRHAAQLPDAAAGRAGGRAGLRGRRITGSGCGRGDSHTFLTHEFVTAVRERPRLAVDICEALVSTAPGFAGPQSALQGGVAVKVRDFGRG